MLLHVVKETDAGIVVRGAKYETAAAYANQAFTKPTIANWGNSAYSDYALGFICDLGSPGLKFICRTGFAGRAPAEDYPLSNRFDEVDTLLIFDDVLIPWENVLFYRHTKAAVFIRATLHRYSAFAFVQRNLKLADMMIGAALFNVRQTGLDKQQAVQEKLAQLAVYREGINAHLTASIALCRAQPGRADDAEPVASLHRPRARLLAAARDDAHRARAVRRPDLRDAGQGGVRGARDKAVDGEVLLDQRGLGRRGSSQAARLRARSAELRLCRPPADLPALRPVAAISRISPPSTGTSTGTARSISCRSRPGCRSACWAPGRRENRATARCGSGSRARRRSRPPPNSTTTAAAMDIERLAPELRQRFLSGMSHAACTVNVVTTDGPAGRAGVTVSAMSSVSADTPKPALLVCVHKLSPAAEAIIENGVFCVNVLRDDQSYISDTFAGRLKTASGDKFECATWKTQATGAPRVVDPLVSFDCTILSSQTIGTHYIFLGAVEDIFELEGGSPLIYANRAYGSASRLEVTARSDEAPHGTLRLGAFHTFGPYLVPQLVARLADNGNAIDLRLLEGDQRRILEALRSGEIDVALLYDFGLGPDIEVERLVGLQPHVLLSEGHGLAERSSLSLEELAPEPLVLLDAPPSGDYFLSLFTDNGLVPNVRYRARSFEMVRGLVGHGLGYSLLTTKPASNMSYDGCALTTRPLRDDMAASHLALAYRASAKLPETATAFAAECRNLFSRS